MLALLYEKPRNQTQLMQSLNLNTNKTHWLLQAYISKGLIEKRRGNHCKNYNSYYFLSQRGGLLLAQVKPLLKELLVEKEGDVVVK